MHSLIAKLSYASIIWMFCRKNHNLKIQKINHKVLKVVFNSDDSYDELLQMNNKVKHSESIYELKGKLKELGNIDCSCILCR